MIELAIGLAITSLVILAVGCVVCIGIIAYIKLKY